LCYIIRKFRNRKTFLAYSNFLYNTKCNEAYISVDTTSHIGEVPMLAAQDTDPELLPDPAAVLHAHVLPAPLAVVESPPPVFVVPLAPDPDRNPDPPSFLQLVACPKSTNYAQSQLLSLLLAHWVRTNLFHIMHNAVLGNNI
jgi:hypothetical protein